MASEGAMAMAMASGFNSSGEERPGRNFTPWQPDAIQKLSEAAVAFPRVDLDT